MLKRLLMVGLLAAEPALAQQSIVGRWEVRHSALGHVYVFAPNGRYEYSRYEARSGTITQLGGERGTYTVQGNTVTMTRDNGTVVRTDYRLAPNAVSMGRNALTIGTPSGQDTFFPD